MIWEWPRSLYQNYSYDPADGRETLEPERDQDLVLRGGSWINNQIGARCAARILHDPFGRATSTVFGWWSPQQSWSPIHNPVLCRQRSWRTLNLWSLRIPVARRASLQKRDQPLPE